MAETLIQYAAKYRDDPWWNEVYENIAAVQEKATNAKPVQIDFDVLKGEYCYNCGMPSDCCATHGIKVQLRIKAANAFKRESKRTVWCHNEECAIQALAVAKYGPASHKWPITLAQFRATNPLADVTKNTLEDVDSKESKSGILGNSDLPHIEAISVTKRGRPRKQNAMTGAERIRAYRRRKEQQKTMVSGVL